VRRSTASRCSSRSGKRLGLEAGAVIDAAHEADQNALDRTHDVNLQMLGHEQATAQADQGAGIASDQMKQQAALQPAPDAGGGE
jgi:hypothetical protein